MYAKLNFIANTPVAGKIRDVVRVINDSYTGNADLNNLEFIDVGSSELVSTVNSGWQLVGGTLPESGTALSTDDAIYYLEGTCVDANKKKHVAICPNYSFTNAGVTTNHALIGIIMPAVIDYGTDTELLTEGYTGANTTSASKWGVGQSAFSEIVHIFATPRKLIIIGYGAVLNTQPTFMGHLEFAENSMTLGHNLSPIAKINCLPNSGGAGTAFTNGALRGESVWANDVKNHYYFPKSIYDTVGKLGLWRVAVFDSEGSRNNGIYEQSGTFENGTTTGATGLAKVSVLDAVNTGKFGHSFYNPACSFGSRTGTESAYANVGKEFDSNGNLRIPAIPLSCNIVTMGTGLIDFSQCNVYKTVGNLGVYGDELTVNGSNYFYFTLAGCPGALIIKKE